MKHAKPKPRPALDVAPSPTPSLSDLDADAYRRAIEIARQESPARAKQIEDKLRCESFEATGEFAAYCTQCSNLRLKPWQAPPCHVRGDAANLDPTCYGYRPGEVALRDRLLAAGLSRFEPDPVAALARVERDG
jgi:hypothetical protein